ncbi:tagatose-bisphosphate aldolase [Candidatus Wolfebacteria bacterium CG10_big_fil_rev_8_21_14_0_10_31_9]|uniref:Tagatose-bisphosphate aldolase n=1 Tax=Candidatus Wolfebacteria bacterium CG10_big_fil_rev_8_21_14_0_10_31_9 TaxID=1975070 RepID=A0A2H0REQ2_9BACT|nr:MAG: tagatose-bisphosphate aldolase [Candidatus Wolfebacteria bacterium CG10_big_fil_rev_8_21_14_0_10_31_9]
MKTLKEYILEAEKNKVAIGHFNISDIAGLKGIFESAKVLNLPIIIGASEGEAGFIGYKQIGALIKSLREQYNYPIFLNADHTKSLEKIKEAVEAGFDAVLFDAGKLSFEENIKKTKEVVEYVKSVNPNILVEAELGYLGSGSVILKEISKDVSIKADDLTKPEEAKLFVQETGVDLLAPAVGNIHGMFKNVPNPNLDINRIKEIRQSAGIPLVLHGGSGIKDEDFTSAIEAGVSIIHINTEIRLAWRQGLEKGLKENPEEVTPYKILPCAIDAIKEVVEKRLKLFSKINQ